MDKRSSTTAGYIYTLQAFLAWGILPIYWKLLNSIPALEILSHRIFWSFIFLFIWLLFTKQQRIWDLLKQKKTRNSLLLSSILIGSNWGLYIYAVNSNQIIEASLGYYITPLMNIMLGIIVLKEKLDNLKLLALIIACISVIYLTLDYGKFPWISICLAVSFSLYGLIKKTAGIEAMPALSIETLILTPIAATFIGYKMILGTGALFADSSFVDFMFIMSGVATTLPLYWFAKGAQRIPLSSLGFMQYIGPSIMLIIGIVMYKETFSREQAIAFGMIWIALVLYTISMIINTRKNKIIKQA
ncbi:EamA family transporter RarD [Ancylomarina sp. 16SWW S1-10-2]|uniref:EamA family transporter RarD n=1 Tax=Ancylomarina sp. 16SWW S1-10-2 TaxID=2499681 RepID=UPI0012ADC8C5|nr:EamA family transporter RarD [Ancylomarina sp. 16SWW S1-10-2]MRT94819.1 EamA family transporter RarD [Ancylomarina sp. 16SWW S1-10-2]